MIGSYLWIASLMFIGAWLLYWRKKRKFVRQNEYGVEQYRSYMEKLKAEAFNTLLLWAGYISLISSLFMLITNS